MLSEFREWRTPNTEAGHAVLVLKIGPGDSSPEVCRSVAGPVSLVGSAGPSLFRLRVWTEETEGQRLEAPRGRAKGEGTGGRGQEVSFVRGLMEGRGR